MTPGEKLEVLAAELANLKAEVSRNRDDISALKGFNKYLAGIAVAAGVFFAILKDAILKKMGWGV